MKKVLRICIVILIVVMSVFAFTGCNDKEDYSLPRVKDLPDLADCEIGYKLPVYPNHPFDYEMSDGTIVHIEKIEATLVEKNVIKPGDTIKGEFYPYKVELVIEGYTDKIYAGKKIGVTVWGTEIITLPPNGEIHIRYTHSFKQNTITYFTAITWK